MKRHDLVAMLAPLVLTLSACGVDLNDGGQFVGQRCFGSEDCASGLVCSAERICVPEASRGGGGGGGGGVDMTPDTPIDLDTNPDLPPDPDFGRPDMPPDYDIPPDYDMKLECGVFGEPYCTGDQSFAYCGTGGGLGGDDLWYMCDPNTRCVEGYCVQLGDECQAGTRRCLGVEQVEVCRRGADGVARYRPGDRCVDGAICQRGECMLAPEECVIGDRFCLTEQSYDLCLPNANGRGEFQSFMCPPDTLCERGECIEACIDRDGDGAYANCEPFDCNDRNANVSPLRREACNDMLDNNCNGRIDEGCMMPPGGCCTGQNACGPNQFCKDCQCRGYNPVMCTTSGQPCNNLDSFENGFYCLDLQGNGQGSCIGLCDLSIPNPDTTCPEPGQTCTFGDDQSGVGLCFDGCAQGDNCGSPQLGCFLVEDPATMNDGVCVPGNPNKPIGATCDASYAFDCADGALCMDLDGDGLGTCSASCRPFRYSGATTDCAMGSHCVALDESFGVCAPDNGLSEFDLCQAPNTTCGEDAVACYPSPVGNYRCRRTCRLSQGASDCNPNQVCRDVNQGQSPVGVCVAR